MPNQNMGTWLMRPVSSVAISCAGFVDTQHSWLDKLNTQHGHFRKLRRLAMKITNRLFFRVLHALYMNHCAGNLENEILITHTPEWNWGRTHANFCWKKGTQALNKASGFVPLVSHKNYDFLSFYVYLSIYFLSSYLDYIVPYTTIAWQAGKTMPGCSTDFREVKKKKTIIVTDSR